LRNESILADPDAQQPLIGIDDVLLREGLQN
jgi:hypothetical protein